MIVFTATLIAKTGKEKELEAALINMVSSVQNEEGAMAYILHRATDHPGQFTVYEKYKDKAALDYHNATPHMGELRAKLDLLLEEEVMINHYEEIAAISR
jgi:quinol monooxygenase YgiN